MTAANGASRVSSFVSLIKTIVGAGLLSMPLAFSTDGLIGGFFIVLLAALTAGYGLFLQVYVSRYVATGHASFFNVCSISYPALSVVFDLAIAIQCFGCAVSYLVLIGDLMPTIVRGGPGRVFWILASAVLCVPLSFLRNLDSLKYTSIMGLGAIAYLCVLVVLEQILGDLPPEARGEILLLPGGWKSVCSTFSIIVFAFTGHQNMFSIINEAGNKSLVSLATLVNMAVWNAATLFVVVGICGYLTFGNLVGGNVVLLYPDSLGTHVGRFAIVFMVVFLFPLMIHPARLSVNNIYYWVRENGPGTLHSALSSGGHAASGQNSPLLGSAEEPRGPAARNHVVPFSHTTFCVITALLLAAGYYLAVSLSSFALVLAVVGATGSTAISFILPGLFGYKLIGLENERPSRAERMLRGLSLMLTVWGLAVMVVCLYSSLAL
ncbi:hypothetical protein METBIDRAFT_40106 [Metschnikowia bicuspidata var. bicuspidata NRRL YB-4993]|uniref:Amino acid transporter transmembrane domain-containing protein n=1 Tax=Metschnikowia bicuspidata var. bicuspidata NRRL YB-4993 TaxID=869754 RepID=A0A1A0HD68_9ASCO|nr:hypothetical protein METBIDRAFT_40106 [Metschnikowia bicuspidata var. bicuspidata NRRL YB-4993]OBA21961.1 hypothetical protein METBIDRAFT_40106 [Metschnikowia bicuspidata var. bicuspidata NRRL YB-4993]